MDRKGWITWALKRLVVPITWFASMVFVVGPATESLVAEFLIGASILVGWAIFADFPKRPK